jgi:hypothetical protein
MLLALTLEKTRQEMIDRAKIGPQKLRSGARTMAFANNKGVRIHYETGSMSRSAERRPKAWTCSSRSCHVCL